MIPDQGLARVPELPTGSTAIPEPHNRSTVFNVRDRVVGTFIGSSCLDELVEWNSTERHQWCSGTWKRVRQRVQNHVGVVRISALPSEFANARLPRIVVAERGSC